MTESTGALKLPLRFNSEKNVGFYYRSTNQVKALQVISEALRKAKTWSATLITRLYRLPNFQLLKRCFGGFRQNPCLPSDCC